MSSKRASRSSQTSDPELRCGSSEVVRRVARLTCASSAPCSGSMELARRERARVPGAALALFRRSRTTRRRPLAGLDGGLRYLLEGFEELRATLRKTREKPPRRERTPVKRREVKTKESEVLTKGRGRLTNREGPGHDRLESSADSDGRTGNGTHGPSVWPRPERRVESPEPLRSEGLDVGDAGELAARVAIGADLARLRIGDGHRVLDAR